MGVRRNGAPWISLSLVLEICFVLHQTFGSGGTLDGLGGFFLNPKTKAGTFDLS